MATEFEKFKEANKKSQIVEAAWTTNGKPIDSHPINWNYMRIRLKDKQEFLLSREDINKITDFSKCWEERS